MMCSLGRHQLDDDIKAPRARRHSGARTFTRAQLEAQKAKMRRALEEETGHIDPGQAAAQEQFVMQFEPLPPGADLVAAEEPAKLPYWANMP